MSPKTFLLVIAISSLAGCSEGTSLSTSSIFGGKKAEVAAAAPPVVTPAARALQVGGTAARAKKCGYNFDADKLRSTFLASEATQAGGADQANLVATYDTSYNAVSKAAGGQSGYCTATRTKDIKAALNRHLAGDYTPDPPKPKEEEDGGLFSGFGSGSSSSDGVYSTLSTDNSRD